MTIILAFDPSTDITGAALIRLDQAGPAVVRFVAIDASRVRRGTDLTARIARIAFTRGELAAWLATSIDMGLAPTHIAFEAPPPPRQISGWNTAQAMAQAVGAYLSIPSLLHLPVEPIFRQSACGAVGAGRLYSSPAGKTSKEQAAKRASLKAAVIEGVNRLTGLELTGDQDAEADAIAVGLSAAGKLEEERKKAAQGTLKLRKAPVRKPKVAA